MRLLRLALRNLTRNLRRTVLSLGSVIAGVAVIILGQGLIGGLEENAIRSQVDTMSGHVLIRPAGYPTEGMSHPVEDLVEVDTVLAEHLAETARSWAPRTLFVARAVNGPDALRVRAIGFDPERDETVFPRTTWNLEGEIPTSAADGILASRGVAKLLQLSKGDRVVLQTRTARGAINALDVPVAGVLTVGSAAIDNFARLSRGARFLEGLTREDWEEKCDQSVTDSECYLREAQWYARRLGRNFTSCGGGVHAFRL